MYTPAHFAPDAEFTARFLREAVAGDLVTNTSEGLIATHLPVLYDADEHRFLAHMARNNGQWSTGSMGDALLILHGPSAYISPTWYAAKAETHRVVPTFNYVTAHVYGTLVMHDDVTWVEQMVRALTERHESHRESAWHVDDAPADYLAGQLRAIVGIELRVTRVEVKNKASQNRPDTDVDGIVAGLTAEGLGEAAALVRDSRRA